MTKRTDNVEYNALPVLATKNALALT
jgi:hypothetical protein